MNKKVIFLLNFITFLFSSLVFASGAASSDAYGALSNVSKTLLNVSRRQ